MNQSKLLKLSTLASIFCLFGSAGHALAQANNSSTVTNSAAPSASSITSGGTNVNYQTNNSFNNENGFGPGIFCRTPSLYVGGNWGNTNQNNIDISNNTSYNNNSSYAANIGLVVPFGSTILKDCAELSRQLTLDRKISTDLSLIRACDQLRKEGIAVDPDRFPYLEKCAVGSLNSQPNTVIRSYPTNSAGQPQQVSPKVPKVTKS